MFSLESRFRWSSLVMISNRNLKRCSFMYLQSSKTLQKYCMDVCLVRFRLRWHVMS